MNESFFGIEGTRGTTILRGEWLFEIWKVMNVSFFGIEGTRHGAGRSFGIFWI